jgi:hypothetical protein
MLAFSHQPRELVECPRALRRFERRKFYSSAHQIRLDETSSIVWRPRKSIRTATRSRAGMTCVTTAFQSVKGAARKLDAIARRQTDFE